MGLRSKPARTAACASLKMLLAVGLWLAPSTSLGDEPGRLGRLFRFGSSPTTVSPSEDRSKDWEVLPISPPSSAPIRTAPGTNATVPEPPSNQPVSRLVPQPRVTRAATDADPILTRVTLGRSDDGRQFGMFLQVYTDGTVIDSDGVHSLGREAIKPVVEALSSGELHRTRGHCGAPATDFIEIVQMVVYERGLGRLRANAFSFSGNPQNCEPAVRHLQIVLDALLMKVARPATTATETVTSPAPASSIALPSPMGQPTHFAATPPPITPNFPPPLTTTGAPPIRLEIEPADKVGEGP